MPNLFRKIIASLSLVFLLTSCVGVFSQEEAEESVNEVGEGPQYTSEEIRNSLGQPFFYHNDGQIERADCEYYVGDSVAYVCFGNKGMEFVDKYVEEFVGIDGEVVLEGRSSTGTINNFYVGDPSSHREEVPSYYELVYSGFSEGVDLEFVFDEVDGQYILKSEYVVEEGADLPKFVNQFDGVGEIVVDEVGDLVIYDGDESYTYEKPYVYQYIDGENLEVDSQYELRNGGTAYEIVVGDYDSEYSLVVDPVLGTLDVSTFWSYDRIRAIDFDGSGNVYVAGGTLWGVHLGKFDADLTTLSANTYYSGSSEDVLFDLVYANSSVYISGASFSNDLVSGGYDVTYGGNGDGFVAKFNTSLTHQASTYYGGTGQDYGRSVDVDGAGNIYMSGWTLSDDMSTPGAYDTSRGGQDGYIVKFDSGLENRLAATYVGGANTDYVTGMVVEGSYVYFSGANDPGAGNYDGFVSKLSTTLASGYSNTVIAPSGGGLDDWIVDLVYSNSYIYALGYTNSTNFSMNGYDTTHNGGYDMIVYGVTSGTMSATRRTYLGGSGDEFGVSYYNEPGSIDVDSSGNVYVVGFTYSTDYPTTNGYSTTNSGNADVVITSLSSDLSSLNASTYHGGTGWDFGNGLKVDSSDRLYVSGLSGNSTFPSTAGAYDTVCGTSDGFLTRFDPPSIDANSTITAGLTSEPPTIDSLEDTQGEEVIVFDFVLTDLGTADGLATIVDALQIVPGSANNVGDWTNTIAGARLCGDDLTCDSGDLTGVVGASAITFTQNDMISVADGGNETYKLKIWLKTDLSLVSEGNSFEFKLADTGITEDVAGSAFASGSQESGDTNVAISTVATEVRYEASRPPSSVSVGAGFNVTAEATDVNGNIDTGETDPVTLVKATGGGTLSSATGVVQSLSAGRYEWTDVKYDIPGDFTIEAQHGSLTNVTSGTITASADTDGTVAVGAGSEPLTIDSLVDTEGEKILVFDVALADAGSGDSIATIIDQLVISQGSANDVGNWTNAIAGAKLYGPDLGAATGVELAGTVGETTITFASEDMISVADGTSETYELRIYLNTDLSSVSEGDNLEFKLNFGDITEDTSGSLIESGAPESGDANVAIDIAATQLSFESNKPPGVTALGTNFNVTVTATDANGNVDTGDTTSVTVARNTGIGALSSATGLVQSLVSGVYAWTNVRYDTAETFKIDASGGALTMAVSSNISAANDATSTVAASADLTEPATISSLADTEGEKVTVFDFTFTDLATVDSFGTIIDQIVISQGSANGVADWTDAIAGAYLNGTDVSDLAGTVAATTITFASNDMITITSGANETYQLKIYLKTDLSDLSDNDVLEFAMDYSDITVDAAGSGFGSGAPESGDANVAIDIDATKLVYQTDPPDATPDIDTDLTVVVQALDVNDNLDTDESTLVTLALATGTGALSSVTGVAQSLSSGAYTWTDVQYDTIETFTVEAQSATLTNVTTSSMTSEDTTDPVGLASFAVLDFAETTSILTWTAVTSESSWEASPAQAHYEIWYGTDDVQVALGTGGAGTIEWDNDDDVTLATQATVGTTITGLLPNTTYYFKIYAVDSYGNAAEVAVGAYDDTTTTLAAVPVSGSVSPSTCTVTCAVSMSWGANTNPGTTVYTVQRDGSTIGTTMETSLSDSLSVAATYAYTVYATNGDATDTTALSLGSVVASSGGGTFLSAPSPTRTPDPDPDPDPDPVEDPDPEEVVCSDTDGLNYFTPGVSYGPKEGSRVVGSYPDTCGDTSGDSGKSTGSYIAETHCNSVRNYVHTQWYKCKYGCSEGACISPPTEPEPTPDPEPTLIDGGGEDVVGDDGDDEDGDADSGDSDTDGDDDGGDDDGGDDDGGDDEDGGADSGDSGDSDGDGSGDSGNSDGGSSEDGSDDGGDSGSSGGEDSTPAPTVIATGGIKGGTVSKTKGGSLLIKLKEKIEEEVEDIPEVEEDSDEEIDAESLTEEDLVAVTQEEFYNEKSNIHKKTLQANKPHLITVNGDSDKLVEVIGAPFSLLDDLKDIDLEDYDEVEEMILLMDSYDEVQLDDEGFGLATINVNKPGKYFITTYVDGQLGELIYFEVVKGGRLAMLQIDDLKMDGYGMDLIAFGDAVDGVNERELERMLAQNNLVLPENAVKSLQWVKEMYQGDSRYFKGLIAGTNYDVGFNDRLIVVKADYEDVNMRVLTGYAEPGKKVVVAFRSVTFASVVISDKETGYFEVSVPADIEQGDHVAYVYSVDDKANEMSSVVRMLFRIYGSVEG